MIWIWFATSLKIIKRLNSYLLLLLDFIPLFLLEDEIGSTFGMEDREDELRVLFLEILLE